MWLKIFERIGALIYIGQSVSSWTEQDHCTKKSSSGIGRTSCGILSRFLRPWIIIVDTFIGRDDSTLSQVATDFIVATREACA